MSSVEGSVLRNNLPFFQNSPGSLVSMTIERLQRPIGLIEGVQQVMCAKLLEVISWIFLVFISY